MRLDTVNNELSHRPISAEERVIALDVLRGFALLGFLSSPLVFILTSPTIGMCFIRAWAQARYITILAVSLWRSATLAP